MPRRLPQLDADGLLKLIRHDDVDDAGQATATGMVADDVNDGSAQVGEVVGADLARHPYFQRLPADELFKLQHGGTPSCVFACCHTCSPPSRRRRSTARASRNGSVNVSVAGCACW